MLKKILKNHAEKIRFGSVGAINTAIDFSILFILVELGLPNIVSNFISTSVALIFSFFANKKFTFKTDKTTAKHFTGFIIITLFGLWVIQPVIIESVRILMQTSNINPRIILLIGKTLATIASLIWNYILYKKFVFIKT